jgi:hypothetical protein
MANSFFNIRKDAVFAAGSANFATLISATPTDFGLSATQATAYAALDSTFQAALVTATNPSTRTVTTVQTKNDAKVPLRESASSLAKIIEGTPTVTDTQKRALGISVRATPTPMPPLGKPSDFAVGVEPATGALNLKWKNTNPRGASGAVYQIWRRVGATGEFAYLGGVGGKSFVDDSLPAGTSQVHYQIQAVRSTSVGPFALFTVNFGAGGSGGVTVTESAPVRIAA